MSEYVAMAWRMAGACATADPNLFFPAGRGHLTARQVRTAIQICAGCPVRRECLEYAVTTREAHGIWGGTTPDERLRAHRDELSRRRAERRRAARQRGKAGQPAA
jgi:WhiB family redox-sensing transcriptional regulator